MKKFIALGMVLALTACGASVEDQEHDLQAVQASLPDGCTVHYAGSVRVEGSSRPSRVFYTVCGATTTTTETHRVQHGKTRHDESTVTIETIDAATIGVISQM